MKRIIRLTETDLHRIITESARQALNEISGTELSQYGYDARNMRNELGTDDDGELNAACETEECEELASSIAKDLCQNYGYRNIYEKNAIFDFQFLEKLLKEKYGMTFLGTNEEDESAAFGNDKYQFFLYPVTFYSELGKFKIQNMDVVPTSWGWR